MRKIKYILLIFSCSFLVSQSSNAGPDINMCNPSLDWCEMEPVTLDGSASTGSSLSYSWNCDSDDIVLSEPNQSTVTFDAPDYSGKSPVHYECILTVSDGVSQDSDTALVSYNFTAPPQPQLYAKVDHQSVVLSWTGEAESALDSLTGYSDFEGYRIYKSIDGGNSWGDESYKLYDYDGKHVGWRPYATFDLSVAADTTHCIYQNLSCDTSLGQKAREREISGQDEYYPWIDLGSNSGIVRTFVDPDVIDGVEYTYAITAYDMGHFGYQKGFTAKSKGLCTSCADGAESEVSLEDCCEDNDCDYDDSSESCDCSDSSSCDALQFRDIYIEQEVWDPSNPDKYFSSLTAFASDDIGGYPSIESSIGGLGSKNIVSVIPGYYASNLENISFEGVEDATIFIEPSDDTVGNGDKKFVIVNESALTDKVYKFEIDARIGVETFEGYHTEDPLLYVYEVESPLDHTPKNYQPSSFPVQLLDAETASSYAEKPGAKFDGTCTLSDDSVSDTIGYDECVDGNGEWTFLSDLELPIYEIDAFELKYLDDVGYENNWTDFFDGIRFRFDNPDKQNLIESPVVINEQYTTPDSLLIDDLKLEFFTSSANYEKRPTYSYMIELSHTILDTALTTTPFSIGDTVGGDDGVVGCEQSCSYENGTWSADDEVCYNDDNNNGQYDGKPDDSVIPCNDHRCAQIGFSDFTYLPFRVTNLTTGKRVKLIHADTGTKYGEDVGICDPPAPDYSYCDNGVWKDLVGYEDCYWSKNELIKFYEEVLYDDEVQYASTYQLKVDFPLYYSLVGSNFNFDDWDDKSLYNLGDQVNYFGMLWYATDEVSPGLSPNSFIDSDQDNINDNPWKVLYPWSTDGFGSSASPSWSEIDTLYIKPTRWYVDGDSWIADFSKIGLETETTQEDLELVRVVPNPYIVNSSFNEDSSTRRLWFTHLPQECRIVIYTQTGEIVDSIEHNDQFSGQKDWNLKNAQGEEVAPGLYIYVIETKSGFSHFGKFAIVR